ncbi:hypothetical protein DRO58_01950 [Candidatus Bathyarchaeota archaeon]|nr:MAG: hypothetical protein DRO58_01950 [Candidatus Bathyarchaeota archaeon]
MPNRRLGGCVITFKPEALQSIGVLEQITDKVASKKAPILLLKTSISLEDVAEALIVLDLTGLSVNMEEIVSEIKSIPLVARVEILEPVTEGVIIDYVHFPPMIMGKRAILMRRTLFEAFVKQGYNQFGPIYSVMLYHIGFHIGVESFREHITVVNGNKHQALKLAEAMFKHAGFGILETKLSIEKGLGEIRVYGSLECEVFKGADKPSSHFIRGIISGWMTTLAGEKREVEEVKCIAAGDPYCEFYAKEVGK